MGKTLKLILFILLACVGLFGQVISTREIRLTPEAQPTGLAGVYKLYLDSTSFQLGCVTPASTSCGILGAGGGSAWNFRGAWAPSTVYNANDVVTNLGSSYLATTTFTSGTTFGTGTSEVWNTIALAGSQGPQGAPGTNATVSVGTTTTLAAGSPATVSNTGTPSAAIFNFGIPTGATGSIGPTGSTGPAGQGFTFRGAWAASTGYHPYDVVTNGGQSYTTTATFTSGSTFGSGTGESWSLIAQKGDTGATGAPGGTANWRGAWSSATSYAINDAVTNGSPASSYYAIAASTNQAPPNATYWQLIASAGATGAAGPTGPTGPTGSTGPAGQGFNFRGAWAASTVYNAYDVVTNGGQTYEADHTFTSGTTFSSANWNTWAQKGADGNGFSVNAPVFTVDWTHDTSTMTAGTFGQWTPINPITLKQAEFYMETAPSGCTTYPVMDIWDGTTSYCALTATSGSHTATATCNSNINSGTVLNFRIKTAASGCTNTGATPHVTIQYVMQ